MSIPYTASPSSSQFFVPKTLQSDFDNFLSQDIPGAVEDYILVPDWYVQADENYKPTIIRGEIYPDATKSRYENTDNNLNFRASLSSGIKKGDMLIDVRGMIYILDWGVPPQPNNLMSRALRCNAWTTFQRYKSEEVDENGYLIQESGNVIIADKIPCNSYRQDGRLEYTTNSEKPGLIPNTVTMLTVQYNEQTKNLRVNDTFIWHDSEYEIADIDYVGVNLNNTSGTLSIQAKKKVGGSIE